MRFRHLTHSLASVLFVFALALGACKQTTSDAVHQGHGVVEAVDTAQGQVTINHGDIPDFMMAMTMTFHVDDPAILGGVAAGQTVDFDVKLDGERYVVTKIAPAN